MGALDGETVCITGKFSVSRNELTALCAAEGAKSAGSVTKAVTILLCEEPGTAKYCKAESMGIPIHDEAWLRAQISGSGGSKKKATTKKAAPKAAPKAAAKAAPSSMSIAELKKALQEKGLKVTGKKDDMIARLEEAKGGGSSNSNAPSNDSGGGDYSSMAVGELKALCIKAGLKVSGKKADLIARLEESGGGDDDDDDVQPPPAKKAKVEKKKSTESKTAPPPSPSKGGGGGGVDRRVPGKEAMAVHENYNIKLNQTNIGGNNNKYYIIQLLSRGGNYFVWTRWGRVGEDGQNKLDGKGGDLAGAIKGFEKKFKDKTANNWGDRDNFVKKSGKYQLVEVEEGGDEGEEDSPMGRLTKAQIEKGQAVLSQLEGVLKKSVNMSVCNELSSQFFSLIPTSFGRQRPEPITSLDALRAKEELLKFYLRMGFEDMKEDEGLQPIDGVMDLPCPATLQAAAAKLCDSSEISRCVTKGQELATKKAGNTKKELNKELYAAILLYTSNAIYANLNKSLREENRAAIKKYFEYLRLFLEAMAQLPQQASTLWRGISVDLFDQYTVGSTITWWGVSSTTSDQQVARNFMNGCGGKCSFLTIKAKTACDISQITFYANEKESLLAPGTQLKVVSKKRVGNVSEITLEEVGRCIA